MQNRRSHAGTSLVETLVGVAIISSVLIGAMTLYVNTARSSMRAEARVFTSGDAANAAQFISELAREAYYVHLPGITGDADFNQGVASVQRSGCLTTGSDGKSIITGFKLRFPADVVVKVRDSSGDENVSLSGWLGTTATATGSMRTVCIYRSDKDGQPAPTNGSHLWVRSDGPFRGETLNSALVRLADPRLLPPTPTDESKRMAVFGFDENDTDRLTYQIRVTEYSPVGQKKRVNSDATDDGASQITARTIRIRGYGR